MTHEPDFNELTAFVERRLSETERARVIAHLSTCAACREIVAALAQSPEHAGAAGVPQWRRVTGLLSLAAMLLVTVIVGVISTRRPPLTPAVPAAPPVTDTPTTPPAVTPGPPPAVSSPASPTRPVPATRPGDLQRTRGAERIIEGRTFRFVSGEWIDSRYDPQQALPVVEATTTAERDALLQRVPALKAFTTLGGRIIVVLDGTVYRY